MELTGERPDGRAPPPTPCSRCTTRATARSWPASARASSSTSAAASATRPSGSARRPLRDRRRLQHRRPHSSRPRRTRPTRARRDGPLRFVASDGAAPRTSRPQRRLRRLVAHHRALRRTRRSTCSSSRASLRTDGTAFVITPNAPADFENPFHVYLFEAEHLVSLLSAVLRRRHLLRPRRRRRAARRLRGAPRERRQAAEARRASNCATRSRTSRTCGRTSTSCRSRTRSSAASASGIGSGIDASHFRITRRRAARHPRAVRGRDAKPRESQWHEQHEGLGDRSHARRGREHRALRAARARRRAEGVHILVVDDGSTDGTADKAEALGAEFGGIEVLRRPQKMGLGSAYRAGSRDRHRPGLRRDGADRRRPLARPGRAPRPARGGRTGRRPRDRLALRARRRGAQLAEATPVAVGVGQPLRRLRARHTAYATRRPVTARTERRSSGRWTSSRRTPPDTRSRSR